MVLLVCIFLIAPIYAAEAPGRVIYPQLADDTLIQELSPVMPKNDAIYSKELIELADKIITCESNWNVLACNKKYGCKAGMGLWQFIPSTWKETNKRMKRDINSVDVFNFDDNYSAGLWLLKTDGDKHWQPYSGWCYLRK